MTFSPADAALIAAISFFAALAQGATGFGFAIIALPLFLSVMDSLDAVGLTIILNLLVSFVLVPGLWRQVPKGPLARLSLGSVIGFPIGLAIFLHASLDGVRLAVGLIILLFAVWLAAGSRQAKSVDGPRHKGWMDAFVGILSGAMTTALAMPGPSLMLYLSAIGMDKAALRATTLCLFTLSYGTALILQAAVGAVPILIWQTVALAALPTVIGAWAGHRLAPKLGDGLFRTIVLAILVATGLYTTFTAILAWA